MDYIASSQQSEECLRQQLRPYNRFRNHEIKNAVS